MCPEIKKGVLIEKYPNTDYAVYDYTLTQDGDDFNVVLKILALIWNKDHAIQLASKRIEEDDKILYKEGDLLNEIICTP